MKIAITTAFLTVMLFLVAMSSYAQGDLTPPVLVDLQIEPAMVDTGDSAQTITFTARITDDLSGFDHAWLIFKPLVPSTQDLGVYYREDFRVSGTALDGVYMWATDLPRHAAEGRWQLVGAQTYDVVGNIFNSGHNSDDWPARFNDYHFANVVDTTATPTITPTPAWTATPTLTPTPTITPTPTGSAQGNDLVPPVLVDLQIEPSIVDTTGSAQVITFTARITDDLSGFTRGGLRFTPPGSSTQYLSVSFYEEQRVSGTALDGVYLDTAIVPQYAAAGRWQMDRMDANDKVGNGRYTFLGADDWPGRFNNYHFVNGGDTTPTPTPAAKLYLPLIERAQ